MHSILRVAHSLWSIMTSLFKVVITNYFDDFVAIAAQPECESVTHTVKAVFRLLGWRFAEGDHKDHPFASTLAALCVSFDVSLLHDGVVTSDNTESRQGEVAQAINEALRNMALKRHDALRLRGRMQFAAGQIYGRLSRRCLALVTQHACSSETSTLDAAAIHALNKFKYMLTSSPRKVSCSSNRCIHIFTDASFEPQADQPFAGIEAVLVDDNGNKLKFSSEELDPVLIEEINVSKRKTIIFECEFLSVLCAMVTWKAHIFQCNVVIHTDNDAARGVFIACHSTNQNVLPSWTLALNVKSPAVATLGYPVSPQSQTCPMTLPDFRSEISSTVAANGTELTV